MRRTLVVGGAGYIGGALVDMLMDAGHDVTVYDALLYEREYRKPVRFVYGDIRDSAKLGPLLDEADIVVWLAALVGDGACSADPKLTMEINTASVKWLADSYDGPIVFTSTCSVYGAAQEVVTEGSPLNPLSAYAVSKAEAESAVVERGGVVFRLGTLFGLADNFSRVRMDLVVNYLTARAACDHEITVFGGAQYRPLLHVRDAAKAILQNIDSPHAGVFNLHAENMSIRDLAERIGKHFEPLAIRYTDIKFQDNRNYRVSSAKAAQAFGFSPQLTVDHGINEIKQLLEERRIKDINDPRYSNSESIRRLHEASPTLGIN